VADRILTVILREIEGSLAGELGIRTERVNERAVICPNLVSKIGRKEFDDDSTFAKLGNTSE